MNCSSSGAHQFSLERECSLESTDQLKKELANQGRGGSRNTGPKIKRDQSLWQEE